MTPLRSAPKQEKADQYKNVGGAMKDTVHRVLNSKFSIVDWIPVAQHGMPLEHLVQYNAVEKTTWTRPEENASRSWEGSIGRNFKICRRQLIRLQQAKLA